MRTGGMRTASHGDMHGVTRGWMQWPGQRYVNVRARGQAAGAPVVRGRQGSRVSSKSARQSCHSSSV